MESIVNFGRALADPTRVRILSALRGPELCVCELVDALGIRQSTISTHLQALRAAGIVATEKRRTWIAYSIAPGARKALDSVFDQLLPHDDLLKGDVERLAQRLLLRVDGCCVVGSPSPRPLKEIPIYER